MLIVGEITKEELCVDSASNIRFLKVVSGNVESAPQSPLNNTYVQVAKLVSGHAMTVGWLIARGLQDNFITKINKKLPACRWAAKKGLLSHLQCCWLNVYSSQYIARILGSFGPQVLHVNTKA